MTTEQLITPRVDKREWVRQQEELAYLFAKFLDISLWQYRDTLPAYTPQPEGYEGRFDTVVLIQPPRPEKGLSFKKILDIVGISSPLEVLKEDWNGDEGTSTPSVVYATWMNDGGGQYLNMTPMKVRENLANDMRGGIGLDGVFLHVADCGVLRRNSLYLPGSDSDLSGFLLSLYLQRDGSPELSYRWKNTFSRPDVGALVAGRKIVLGNSIA